MPSDPADAPPWYAQPLEPPAKLPLVERKRLLQRSTDLPEVVETRLHNAPGELMQYREYDYLVVNDDLEQAVARLVAIVDAERARVRRLRAE